MTKHLVLLLTLSLAPLPALAQDAGAPAQATPQPAPNAGGPMTFEAIHSGWLVAPDAKITQFDGQTDALLGASGGWITDDTFFVGGAADWLVNPSSDHEMWYGGLSLQWLAHTQSRFGYAAKGLIGGGEATLGGTTFVPVVNPRRGRVVSPAPVRTLFHQAFFLMEPEADVLIRLTHGMRITAGAGYRFTFADYGGDSRLRGAVGTVGLQIGGGS
jgi:hypothetical protein